MILYVFHEINDRVHNFINQCIFKDNNFDFIFIINNKYINIDNLNIPNYVKIIFRDNIGYDFGAWSEGLLTNNLYKHYDSFIFINSSVYGPCMEIDDIRKWPDILLNGLNYNNVKLFGTTINCINDVQNLSHVQSMVFCMDLETLKYLISKNIFSITNFDNTLQETIINKEIRMSREIINNNWNIGCLHTYYKDIDFTFRNNNRQIQFLGDLCYKNNFYGRTIHPYEILFVKGNRNIEPEFIKQYIFSNQKINLFEKYIPIDLNKNTIKYLNKNIINNNNSYSTKYNFENIELINIKTDDDLPIYDNIIENFIFIIDFPKYGGGGSVFLNSIIKQYKKYTSFIIIRNYNNYYYLTLNDEYLLLKSNLPDIQIFIQNNINKIIKIFINHIIGFECDFFDYLFSLNKNTTVIIHDYFLIYNEPQYFFNNFYNENEKKSNNFNINKCDNIITQNIKNLNIYNNFINDDNKIIICDLPDFKKSLHQYNTNNNKSIIGLIGSIVNNFKGNNVLSYIVNYYKNNKDIEFIILGETNINNIHYEKYKTITEFNNLLIKYKPNLLLELSLCPETYCYTLTLGMLTQLPILSLRKNMDCVIEERLSHYDKTHYFSTIDELTSLIYSCKQNYLYTIEEYIYYNKYWDYYFLSHDKIIKKSFNIFNLNNNEIDNIKKIKNKNIIVITSKIIVSDNKFSYVNKRSIYSNEERFNQTNETINTIKLYIPNYYIILFDNSKLSEQQYNILNNNVDKFINIINDDNLNHNTDICDLKLISELSQHIYLYDYFLKYINFRENLNYFKISGRYIINENFKYQNYNNEYIIFKKNENLIDKEYYYTSFFKINNSNVNYFYENLNLLLNNMSYNEFNKYNYEELIPNIFKNKIKKNDNLGITQRISAWNEISDI